MIARYIKYIFLLSILPVFESVNAQVLEMWSRTNSSSGLGSDVAKFVQTDSAGNIYVGGNYGVQHVGWLLYGVVKYDPEGNFIWRRMSSSNDGSVRANAMAMDKNRNIYFTGYTLSSTTRIFNVKINKDGQLEWSNTFSGISGFPSQSVDYGYDVGVDSEGYVYVTGTSTGMGTMQDYILIKYNPGGDSLWSRRYNGTGLGDDEAYSMVIDGNNNIYITGFSYGAASGKDIVTLKYNNNGDLLWEQRYNNNNGNESGNRIALDNAGNLIVIGTLLNSIQTVVLKYTESGTLLWSKILPQYYQRPGKLKIDDDNNIIISLQTTAPSVRIVKLNESGDELWNYVIPATENLFYNWSSIDVDTEGNTYYAGNTGNQPVRGNVMKLDPLGSLVWNKSYQNGNGNSYLTSIKFHDQNNIYVSGYTRNPNTLDDFLTIKYSQPENVFLNNFNLLSPETPTTIDLNTMSNNIDFIWTRSNISPFIFYNLKIYRGPTEPSFYLLSNNSGSDTVYSLSPATISSIANSYQTTSDTLVLVWRAVAYNTNDSLYSQTAWLLRVTGLKTSISLNETDPVEFSLMQNYPNPFNPSTVINFSLPVYSHTKLMVYDRLGRIVEILVDEQLNPGSYQYSFSGDRLTSGVYFYKLETDTYTEVRKMVLLR